MGGKKASLLQLVGYSLENPFLTQHAPENTSRQKMMTMGK